MAFLVFEGLDGAGKSTLIQSIADELKTRAKPFHITREPGGTVLGDEIRKMLLRTDGQAPVARAEVLMYQAVRAQHVDMVILPAKKRGDWILCDRFAASSVAFQAGGRLVKREDIDWLNNYSTGGLRADLTILLDLDVDTAMERMSGRELDRFEQEHRDFHSRVRESYLAQAKQDPDNWLVLSAREQPEVLKTQLIQFLRTKKWL